LSLAKHAAFLLTIVTIC